jgi:hypothetical protein
MKTTQMKKRQDETEKCIDFGGFLRFMLSFTVFAAVLPSPPVQNSDYLTLEAFKGALPSHLSVALSLFHFRPHSLGTIKIKTGYETSCESQPDFTDIFNTWGSFIATFFFF